MTQQNINNMTDGLTRNLHQEQRNLTGKWSWSSEWMLWQSVIWKTHIHLQN